MEKGDAVRLLNDVKGTRAGTLGTITHDYGDDVYEVEINFNSIFSYTILVRKIDIELVNN